MLCWSLDQLLESEVKDLPITMMPDGWMEKTGGYAKDMTLRDHFAAQAMAAIIQSGKWGPQTADLLHYEDDRDFVDMKAGCLAEGAYQMADAMIKAGQ